MVLKFAHLADCHLGGWRQEELQKLNFESFQKTVEICITEKVDFILISGDLFDSAYPPIEILKETFAEFRKINNAGIPVFIIAGSHDFSASGKTFLDVLEKAGFCKSVEDYETQEDNRIKLNPIIFKDIAIYGYSGKKSGMEIEDLKKVYFSSIHPFTIFMAHTTITDMVGTIPMESIDKLKLPLANYYALGHIHQVFQKQEASSLFVYPGPVYPNNFQELADLQYGSFQIVTLDDNNKIKAENIKIKLKEVVFCEVQLENGLTATDKIIKELDKTNLKDKIVLLKLKGKLTQGKTGDIRFNEIEDFAKKKEVYSFLKNTSALESIETEIKIEVENTGEVEEKVIGQFTETNKSDFNKFLPQILNALSIEKNEDEKSIIFENRLLSELKKILTLEGVVP
jgi:DNA repair exonuclease SbcCD nuclease subunit